MYGHIPKVRTSSGLVLTEFPDAAKGLVMTADTTVIQGETFSAGNGGALVGGGGAYSGASWRAYDGTITNPNYSGDNAGEVAGTANYALSMGVARAFRKVTVHPGDDGTNIYHFFDFTIERSDDGTVWTIQNTYTGQTGWSAGVGRVFAISANAGYRYWRIQGTNSGLNNAAFGSGHVINQIQYSVTP